MSVYCAQCGKQSVDEARFCSACGRPLTPDGQSYQANAGTAIPRANFRTLVRPRVGRKVAGVCQGLSNLYGWDVTIVRVAAVLLAIFGFPVGLILYGIVWLVAPEEALALTSGTYVSQG